MPSLGRQGDRAAQEGRPADEDHLPVSGERRLTGVIRLRSEHHRCMGPATILSPGALRCLVNVKKKVVEVRHRNI